MVDSDHSRRKFLETALAGSAATLLAPKESWAQGVQSDLDNIFGRVKLTDQHGGDFQPEKLFADKPVIFIFGFNDCDLCGTEDKITSVSKENPGIADSITAMQKALKAKGKDIPIVLVDVLPTVDRGRLPSSPNNAKDHVKAYVDKGLQVTSKGENSYDGAAKLSQNERLFHIAYPPTDKDAETIQSEKKGQGGMGLIQDKKNNTQHSLDAVFFMDGKQTQVSLAVPIKGGRTKEAFEKRGKEMADDFLKQIGVGR
jgi:cytochrome oxidase Cu insertion factor (SCO1/SenC/PrrC family)